MKWPQDRAFITIGAGLTLIERPVVVHILSGGQAGYPA